MLHQDTICHALLKAVPRHRFEQLVAEHRGSYRDRGFRFWSHFVAMIYAQLAGASSLRDLVLSLDSHAAARGPLGLDAVRRSTLAEANRVRPAGLFAAVFNLLLPSLTGRTENEARRFVRLIDATSLRLSETLCGWARFSAGYAAAKLHLVYDPQARCPTYFAITPARINDIVEAREMPIEAGATYVFDLGFHDFGWWAALDQAHSIFVTRLKDNTAVTVLETLPVNDPAILGDRRIRLARRLSYTRRNPLRGPLREILVRRDDGRTIRLVTNDLDAPAPDIAALYKERWQIELFFRWVKQNLRIKTFLGRSENAVRIQILTALIAYLLLRIAQADCPGPLSLQQIARLIRTNLMHHRTLHDLLHTRHTARQPPDRQLSLDLNPA